MQKLTKKYIKFPILGSFPILSFLKKNAHCQLLGFYKTWNLGWKIKYHNNSTFRLLFEKLNDKISKRKHRICPNINKNEFSAIISLF